MMKNIITNTPHKSASYCTHSTASHDHKVNSTFLEGITNGLPRFTTTELHLKRHLKKNRIGDNMLLTTLQNIYVGTNLATRDKSPRDFPMRTSSEFVLVFKHPLQKITCKNSTRNRIYPSHKKNRKPSGCYEE